MTVVLSEFQHFKHVRSDIYRSYWNDRSANKVVYEKKSSVRLQV